MDTVQIVALSMLVAWIAFMVAWMRWMHQQQTLPEKSLTCPECLAVFRYREQLALHLTVHEHKRIERLLDATMDGKKSVGPVIPLKHRPVAAPQPVEAPTETSVVVKSGSISYTVHQGGKK